MTRKSKGEPEPHATAARWLLLIHQLPPKPAYLRVKIWRRLQGLGAISVKNSVYVLPAGEQPLEDFQWLLREIEQGGGEGMVCEANLVDGLSDQEVRMLFDAARDADYAEIAKELRGLSAEIEGDDGASPERKVEIKAQLVRLRRRFSELSGIDFFSATGRMTVEGLLSDLETRLTEARQGDEQEEDPKVTTISGDLTGKTWVTRSGVHVDRIACAWLIRRFIDPGAKFIYVPTDHVRMVAAETGATPYDIDGVEFTHEGERCSFDTILRIYDIKAPPLDHLATIVRGADTSRHFLAPQCGGLFAISLGLSANFGDDHEMLAHGMVMYDALYTWCRSLQAETHNWPAKATA
jgi:hypothetical protein